MEPDPHRDERQQNVGKDNCGVDAQPLDRRNRHLGGDFGPHAHVEKRMLLAHAAVFRHVTSRLAHQPYWCVRRCLAPAGGEHRMLAQAASPRRRWLQAAAVAGWLAHRAGRLAGAMLRAVGRRCPGSGARQHFAGDAGRCVRSGPRLRRIRRPTPRPAPLLRKYRCTARGRLPNQMSQLRMLRFEIDRNAMPTQLLRTDGTNRAKSDRAESASELAADTLGLGYLYNVADLARAGEDDRVRFAVRNRPHRRPQWTAIHGQGPSIHRYRHHLRAARLESRDKIAIRDAVLLDRDTLTREISLRTEA